MKIIEVANAIQDKIKLLERMRMEIKERAERKAIAITNYYKKKTSLIFQLKNGKEIEYEGLYIMNPTAGVISEIIKGLCWKELMEKERADAEYKSLISNIDSVQAELNGLQSVNRYLDKI